MVKYTNYQNTCMNFMYAQNVIFAINGNRMVQCKACINWFHVNCVPTFNEDDKWYCEHCIYNGH